MTKDELARRLADATERNEREDLIRRFVAPADGAELAGALKQICLDSWTSDPNRAIRAAQALSTLAEINRAPEIVAFADWTAGVAAMINGQLRRAVERFEAAEKAFQTLGRNETAAATQVGKLYPLALLGRYDEAIETGLRAREIFLEAGDEAAAGRVENNLGNIFQRAERYAEAERFLRLARERFLALGDFKLLAQITNSLAYVLSCRYEFREAETFYEEALKFAGEAALAVTKAEIESNLGYFSLFQGRYDRALEFLERARRGYAELEMPHQSAIAELEMADAYTELNLFAEAAEIYSRVIPLFAEIGMPIEHARALANFARVRFVLGGAEKAHALLAAARQIFASCRSEIGEATVLLNEAQFLFAEGKFAETIQTLGQAELPLERAGIKGARLAADCLRAEAWRALGNLADARRLLEETLAEAEAGEIPPLTARCLTALGLTAKAAGETKDAENYFKRAVSVVENLRAPLPSEDFRAAFFGDKLTPYHELMRLCLTDENRVGEAFQYAEKSRSRALLEMMRKGGRANGGDGGGGGGADSFDSDDLSRRIVALREELNWLYNEINLPTRRNTSRDLAATLSLHEAARKRETAVAELSRQTNLRRRAAGELPAAENAAPAIARLRKRIGETALVEYAALDGEFLAFVVTTEGVRVFERLCREDEIGALVSNLYFQLDALRSDNAGRLESHSYELTLRARRAAGEIYDLLLRPLEAAVGLRRRLVVAPHRALHYVPFHALYDGMAYTIENREIAYAPSAAVLLNCLEKPLRAYSRALLVGAADERIPMVGEETKSLASLFTDSVTLLDRFASRAELSAHAARADVLHLACHGQFRSENPLFSSLKLADGWLTVRDVYSLRLDADLVVLSACETGLSKIAPGDELLGLARGFFSAGAASLLLSLWNVHDATTMELMRMFYRRLCAGARPAAALRAAQREMLGGRRPHPFFWAPFFLFGRW
jgi:tetratricopeptide (TPR) repeat protein